MNNDRYHLVTIIVSSIIAEQKREKKTSIYEKPNVLRIMVYRYRRRE